MATGAGPEPANALRVHFLDVGSQEYGDAVLLEAAGRTVLIDGAHPGNDTPEPGHPSIPEQLQHLLGVTGTVTVDLLIVTHCHLDHIGCLPKLVPSALKAHWALVADPDLGWGRVSDGGVGAQSSAANPVLAAAREEILGESTDDTVVARFLVDAANLETDYRGMITELGRHGTVVQYGRDALDALLAEFSGIGLEVLGPSDKQLKLCSDLIAGTTGEAAEQLAGFRAERDLTGDSVPSAVEEYHRLMEPASGLESLNSRPGPAINLQSIVTQFTVQGEKLLFAGDMQLADVQVGGAAMVTEMNALRACLRKRAPFAVFKLCHHGSDNGFDETVQADLSTTPLYGICTGSDSKKHPNADVLHRLDLERTHLQWVRTDHNGLVTIELAAPGAHLELDHGVVNDPEPNSAV